MERQFLVTVAAGLAVWWIIGQIKRFQTEKQTADFNPVSAEAQEALSETLV